MANTSEQPPKFDMNDPEQAMLAQSRQEQPRPPEVKTPEQQMVQDFDLGTKRLNARVETYRTKIAEAQRLMAENQKKGGLNLTANLGIENAIAGFNKDLQPIEEELKQRGPSPEEIQIQKQMQDAEDAKKLRVTEGQQGQEDIDPNYEAQMGGLKKDLETAKLARIKKIQAGEAGGAPEKPQEEPEAQFWRERREEAAKKAESEQAPAQEQPKAQESKEAKPAGQKEKPEAVAAPESGAAEKLAKRRELGKLLETMRAAEASGNNLMDYRKGLGLQFAREYNQLFKEITGKSLGEEADAATAKELSPEATVIMGGAFGTVEAQARMGEIRQRKIVEAYAPAGKLSDLAIHKQMLEKKGIIIADVPLMQLAKQGYKIEPAGFFSRFMGRTVKVTGPDGKSSTLSRIGFQQLQTEKIKQFGEELQKELKGEVQAEMDKIKEKHVRRLIEGAVGSLPSEAQQAPEAVAAAPTPEAAAEPAPAAAPEVAAEAAVEVGQGAGTEAPAEAAPEAVPETPEKDELAIVEDTEKKEAQIKREEEKELARLINQVSQAVSKNFDRRGMSTKEYAGYIAYLKGAVVGKKREPGFKGFEQVGGVKEFVQAMFQEYVGVRTRALRRRAELLRDMATRIEPRQEVPPLQEEQPAQVA